MAFYAANFVYDGIPASEFGLRISSLSEQENSVGASVELMTQSVYRRSKEYLLGVKQAPVLNIPITITVENELTATQASTISKWLFGQSTYKKLQIVQPDMEYVYFNCIFTNPSLIQIGNITRGFSATAVCDSPFAWEFPKATSYNFRDYLVMENILFNNTSDSSDYLYPILLVRANMFGGYLRITNNSDNERAFYISNLQPNETVIIDNDLQYASGIETGINHLQDMAYSGYKWFRYIPGANNLSIEGHIDTLTFINQFPKKIS